MLPCWSNLVLGRDPRCYRRSSTCQRVQFVTGRRRLTGRAAFCSRSRPTHKSGADKLIKLILDTGCAPWPPSLFHSHSHLYNHLPFLCSSLFNHLLFYPPSVTHYARTHTRASSAQLILAKSTQYLSIPLKSADCYRPIGCCITFVFQVSPKQKWGGFFFVGLF